MRLVKTYEYTDAERLALTLARCARSLRESSRAADVAVMRACADLDLPVRTIGEAMGWTGANVSRRLRGVSS